MNTPGVFDDIEFRAPTASQFPIVYDPNAPVFFYGFSGLNYLDVKPFQSAWGVFDFSGFKAPTKIDFPRVY